MTIHTIKLITIYFLTIFLNYASMNLSQECNLPGFKEHRCFKNGKNPDHKVVIRDRNTHPFIS